MASNPRGGVETHLGKLIVIPSFLYVPNTYRSSKCNIKLNISQYYVIILFILLIMKKSKKFIKNSNFKILENHEHISETWSQWSLTPNMKAIRQVVSEKKIFKEIEKSTFTQNGKISKIHKKFKFQILKKSWTILRDMVPMKPQTKYESNRISSFGEEDF